MLINFALHNVGTSVSSDKVNTDGHECTNLISENWHLRRKGFLAEHFLKPPVNVTFQFPCNIHIHQIVLTPCVGRQQSSHLELLSASRPVSKNTNAKKLCNNEAAVSTHPSSSAGSSHTNALRNSVPTSPIFYPVSRITVFTSEPVCFFNPKVSANCSSSYPGDHCTTKVAMQHFKNDLLNASSHITIRILRTVRGSTAAVSNVDIWGMPSISVPSIVKENIVKSYEEYLNPVCVKMSSTINEDLTENGQNNESQGKVPEKQSVNSVNDIPEDFLDAITCEVMAIPMLLPCGKNVDMSTLDRYFNTEASYGRKPRDPFTGVEFSNPNKPVPNGALKARIDHFLMKNCNDKVIGSIPRTVANGGNTLLGKRNVAGHKINKGISLLIQHPLTQNSEVHSGNRQINEIPVINVSNSNTVLPSLEQTSIQRHHIKINAAFLLKKSESKNVSENNSQTHHVTSSDFSSHETQLKDSLNLALSAIRSSFPSSSATDNCVHANVEDGRCSLCQQILSEDKIKYQIPCGHVICRDCLTAKSLESSLKCGFCNKHFERRFAVRKHDV